MSTDLLAQIEQMTDPVEFERLCCDVLTLMGYPGLDPQGVGRRDGGKDALLSHPKFGKIVFHFSLRSDWHNKLREDITTVRTNRIPCDQFVFFTNRKVRAAEKDRWKRYCAEQLHADLELFDQERLRVVISAHKSICATYFPNYFIASDVIAELTKALNRLIDQGLQLPSEERLGAAPGFVRESTEEISRMVVIGQIEAALKKTSDIAKTAIEFQTAAAEGLFFVGCLLYELSDYAASEFVWKNVLTISPAHYSSWHNLAIVMERDNRGTRYGYGFRAQEAIRCYDRAFALATQNEQKADCLDNQGVVFLKTGKMAEAKQKFRQAQDICPNHLSSRLNSGTVADDFETAERIYKSLANTPQSDNAYNNLAATYSYQRRFDLAIRTIRKVSLEFRSNQVAPHLILGKIALERKKPGKAQHYAQRGLVKDFYCWDAHFLLGQVFETLGRIDEAISSFETCIDLAPDKVIVYETLANALAKQGTKKNLDKIVKCLEAALKINPTLRNAHNNIGNAYLDNGMPGSARLEYLKEIELHPDNKLPYFNLGYLAEHNINERRYSSPYGMRSAVQYYREALRLAPDYFEALFNLGTVLCHLGENDEAIDVLEKCLKIRPENDAALCNLACAYDKNGQNDKAIDLWKKALALNPQNKYVKLNIMVNGLVKPATNWLQGVET